MRVSRHTLAQLCNWKANIVWWGCKGGSLAIELFLIDHEQDKQKKQEKDQKGSNSFSGRGFSPRAKNEPNQPFEASECSRNVGS